MGDVDRSRSHKVKAIFIIGLNDGRFPSVNNDEGFIIDTDREVLKEKNIDSVLIEGGGNLNFSFLVFLLKIFSLFRYCY